MSGKETSQGQGHMGEVLTVEVGNIFDVTYSVEKEGFKAISSI